MLDLAIVALVALVATALWLLLRPPLAADRRAASGDPPPAEGDDPADSSGYPDAHGVSPPRSDEHAPDT